MILQCRVQKLWLYTLHCTLYSAPTDIDTLRFIQKPMHRQKDTTLWAWRLHTAQTNLHKNPQKYLLAESFLFLTSRGGVSCLPFCLHIHCLLTYKYKIHSLYVLKTNFGTRDGWLCGFYRRRKKTVALFLEAFVTTWTAFMLQFLLWGFGGNAELKETQLKWGEEDNVIHHIWTGNTCIMYTALGVCLSTVYKPDSEYVVYTALLLMLNITARGPSHQTSDLSFLFPHHRQCKTLQCSSSHPQCRTYQSW